ncbi:hypothetical protein [Asticcacaulis sp. AC460]|uniref:hypothetical protein n=1 Tax=Asticcacaulis sp. AC460 TaxID=1282360 RepID=UPI0012DD7B3A|nr:hypothetical protein [Asticcacaulis sp. AC460]
MTDNLKNANADPSNGGPHLLAGAIELTPEARAILTKQVNRKIVWGYKFAKAGLFVLCGLPLLASLFFGYGIATTGIDNVGQGMLAIGLVGGPAALAWFLSRLVARY